MQLKVGEGFIEYRLPNFAESQRLMAELNMVTVSAEMNDQLIFMADSLEKLGKFVTKIDVDKCEKYEDLLNEPKYSSDLMEYVAILINRIASFSLEKKS